MTQRTQARRAAVAVVALAVLMLAGCSTNGPTTNDDAGSSTLTTTQSAGVRPLEFVELGDSWIAGEHCGYCTTFAGLWAADIEQRTGRTVNVTDFTGGNERSAPQEKTTGSLLWTLQHDQDTIAAIRKADIVLIATGGNDIPMDKLFEGQCGGQDGYACIRSLGPLWHRNYDAIVHAIVDLRNGQPTAIRLLNESNPFLGAAEIYSLVPPEVARTGGALIAKLAGKAMCDAAGKYSAVCIDGRRTLTGPHFDRRFDENAPSTFRALADELDAAGLQELGVSTIK